MICYLDADKECPHQNGWKCGNEEEWLECAHSFNDVSETAVWAKTTWNGKGEYEWQSEDRQSSIPMNYCHNKHELERNIQELLSQCQTEEEKASLREGWIKLLPLLEENC